MLINNQEDVGNSSEKHGVRYTCFKPYTRDNLVPVGFACQQAEPKDQEVYDMVDTVIAQTLGAQGLASIIKPGDKVVIKVNLIGTGVGSRGEKNRGGITDPRIVRYVASKVRDIIGFAGTADLKVVDATFYKNENPSIKNSDLGISFYWARLERSGDNAVDKGDVCYDSKGDGILDGGSFARLVNLDSLVGNDREVTTVKVASEDEVVVCLPKLLRTRKQAEAEGSDEYCDVLIGLPILKSHAIAGLTGAIKLHYGFRHYENMKGDTGRYGHNGTTIDTGGIHHTEHLFDYLSAEHIVRDYDFVIMDCLTANRTGPMSTNSGLLFNSAKNEPIDYILTNAVLASRDSVAIDTVAAVLGGYDPKSLNILKNAHENGLGTNNPKYIQLSGFTDFYKQRQYLYSYYPRNRYPMQQGWGNAEILDNKAFNAAINVNGPERINEGTYAIKYSIAGPNDTMPDLSRAELWINKKFIDYRNEGNICNGEFIFNIENEHLPKDSYMVFIIAAWDKNFNCIQSNETIFKF